MSITEAFEGVPARPVSPAPPGAQSSRSAQVRAGSRSRRQARKIGWVRRAARVVYLDAADSWIAQERSPSARTVWATDYTARIDTPWRPYLYWARAWRPVAVFFALVCDSAKFFLIHPLRGPITLALFAAGYLAVAH